MSRLRFCTIGFQEAYRWIMVLVWAGYGLVWVGYCKHMGGLRFCMGCLQVILQLVVLEVCDGMGIEWGSGVQFFVASQTEGGNTMDGWYYQGNNCCVLLCMEDLLHIRLWLTCLLVH